MIYKEWNKQWKQGCYIEDWKQNNQIMMSVDDAKYLLKSTVV